jgi:hypothetical protein
MNAVYMGLSELEARQQQATLLALDHSVSTECDRFSAFHPHLPLLLWKTLVGLGF